MYSLLADENLDSRIISALRNESYEVASVFEISPGISDIEVLALGNRLGAIILTEDKDFGELTYRLKKPNNGIVLIRLSGVKIAQKILLIKKVLKKYGDRLKNCFTVINARRVRINKLQDT